MTDVTYVYTAPLRRLLRHQNQGWASFPEQLLTTPDAIAIVEMPSAHSREELAIALTVIERLICPWPARAIAPWFWDTQAGLVVALAQWVLYQKEAMWPTQVCQALWGNASRARIEAVNRLVADGRLKAYFQPLPGQRLLNRFGKPTRRPYFRRPQVVALYQQLAAGGSL
jgi:hypothetical protein